ncbi:MAG: EFR1 family ferrodoxin [Bacteroidales bacterium]|jgi:Pyruvate/2-oxoacid:ferredoxin oxidoreductase delta subunit|nr:EFR1 family ferrodoxin [Bacteroidales bacterium]
MNSTQEAVIFYFSGTGNSRRIASWFSDLYHEKGIDCRMFDIAETGYSVMENIDSGSIIGIISSVHGFNFPKIMLDFIRNFPKGKNRLLLMNTRAGMKIGKIVTPGLTGIAFMVSSVILRNKGYEIIGQIPFDMPSNWISIHPALRKKSVDFICEKNRFRIRKHFERLYVGKKDFSSRKDIIQDIIISPVALAYYFVGRYFLAKSYYASHKCIYCGFCIGQCPVNAIKTIDKRPFWTYRCESCMKCMNRCPVDAIETTHGLWVIVIYAVSVACTFFFYEWLPVCLQHWTIRFLLFSILLVGFIGIFYRIQQLLLRNKTIAKIISYTSLTYYKIWGRYRCK